MLTKYETDRLILKILTPNSCNSVLRFYKDNQNIFEPLNPINPENYYTNNYQRSVLKIEYNNFIKGKSVRFFVYTKSNPLKIIGTISFTEIKRNFSYSAILGYRFDEQYHHQGFASESIKKAVEIMFNEEHIHRIEAYIQPDNIPSKKLISRLGFVYEGICYSHTMVQNNWQDMERYALISTDLHQ